MPSGADVTLNVFVPVANKVGGFGVLVASLKKNAPSKSPQLSLNKSMGTWKRTHKRPYHDMRRFLKLKYMLSEEQRFTVVVCLACVENSVQPWQHIVQSGWI